jgi:glycosyltransferase involved in cell wall biosynthesis
VKVCMLMVTECDAFYITARKVAEALTQAGHNVNIIALRGKGTLANEECGGYQISRVNLVTYKHKDDFTKPRFTAIFSKLLWPLVLPLKREAIHVLYAEYWWRVFRVTRGEHFDVYHAHDLNTLPIAWLCARLGKAKLVYDSHELWLDRNIKPAHSRLNRFILERIESFFTHRVDATIMPGEFCADELSQR